MIKSKVLGSIFMVAGSTIGAGMLVMPINSAFVGFGTTFLELTIFFGLMLIPALAIAECCQFAPQGTSIAGIMQRTYGNVGYISNTILLYVFAYSLASAYISGITGILAHLLGVPVGLQKLFTIACLIPLGLIVVVSTKVADLINRAMFYIMVIAFILLVIMSVGNIDFSYLKSAPVSSQAVVKSLPIFFLAFGFHMLVPSLADYLDRNVKDLKFAIVVGLSIPFVIFVIWNLVIHGQATQEQLINFSKESGNINIATVIAQGSEHKVLNLAVTIFSITALITSFIGLSTALITQLKENFKKPLDAQDAGLISVDQDSRIETRLNRLAIFFLVFAIPAVLVNFTPRAFVFFLGFASIISTLQAMIMPMVALIKIRKQNAELYAQANVYRLAVPSVLLGVISLAFLAIALMADLNL